MNRLPALALAFLLSWTAAAPCQVPGSPVADKFQYTRTVWRVSDGLPEDTVQALAESSQGGLWVGTTGGLARFDGSRIFPFAAGRADLSSGSSIFCLTRSRDGALWAGTEGAGLLRIEANRMQSFASAEGLTDSFVRSIFEDDRGRLWVGTDGGLFFRSGARFVRWTEAGSPSTLAVHSITEDREHRLWVGGSRLFSIDADGHEQDYAQPGAFGENRVKRILQTSDGTVWAGTVGGLQRLRKGRFERVPGINSTVRSLLETADGTLWIGTIGSGLWTLHPNGTGPDGIKRVGQPSLLPSDTVLSIFEDNQHQVWVGTQAGLVRLRKTPVSVVSLPEGGDPDFETISGDSRGNVWVAAQKLYLIRDGVAHAVTYGDGSHFAVRNVFRARDGALWIGTDGGGAYRVGDDSVTTHFTAPTQLTNNFIRGFLEASDGTLWIACDEGVNRIGPKGIRRLTEADGLAYSSTRSLLEDRDRSIWIGTDRGLSHWVQGAFVQDAATRALAGEKVWSILEDRTGALWFGTREHGLFRFGGGQIQRLTTTEGLPTNSIYQLLQDRRGTFWFTGPNTIASIHDEQFEQGLAAPGHPPSVTVYSMPFGAEGAQLYGGRQPAGYLAPDDTVWFPTNRGVVHIAAAAAPPGSGPRAYLDEVREDGQPVSADRGTLTIPAHVSRISFSFSAIFLRSQEGVRFRYRLEPFDKTWSLAGSNREATYTNLPSGKYRFRVVAFDTAAPAEVSEIALAIHKQTFFYQTWWFYTLCLLLTAAIAWSVYQFRLRQMRTRFDAVLEERSRLAREMHDTVIQGCTGISALLEAVAITPAQDRAGREELLGLAREQARSTVSEARQVVWDMRHEQEGEVDVVAALRKLALQNQREMGASVAFASSVEQLPLKASMAHEVLMTAREALTNALQHSGSDLVEVALRLRGLELEVSVSDRGCGMQLARPDIAAEGRLAAERHLAAEGHYGILGMQERAARIGGRLSLESTPGQGTRIEVVVGLAGLARPERNTARS